MRFTSTFAFILSICVLIALPICVNAGINGNIGGTITDAGTTSPLLGVSVEIYDSTGVLVSTTPPSDASGNYLSAPLAAGTYYAVTSNGISYQEEIFDNLPCLLKGCIKTSGTPIVVVDGIVTTANFAIDIGGTITGNVIDEMTTNPLELKHVHVHDDNGFIGFSEFSDVSGNYTTGSGLPTGDYHVVCHNLDDYVTEVWDDIPCGSNVCHHHEGDMVSVTAGSSTGGINFALMMPTFFDKFDDGVDPGWTLKNGNWVETGGFYTANHTGKASAIADTVFPLGCNVNCTVEVFMSTLGNQVPGTLNKVSLFGWRQDKKNYVEVVMNEEKDKWQFRHKFNGKVRAKKSFAQTIDPFTLYHVRIHFNGTEFHVFIDGEEVMMIEMAEGSAPNGTVGFGIKAANANFDTLLVYPDMHSGM